MEAPSRQCLSMSLPPIGPKEDRLLPFRPIRISSGMTRLSVFTCRSNISLRRHNMQLIPHIPFRFSSRPAAWNGSAPHDADFVVMLDGYRATGGIARAADIASSLRHRKESGAATVARWIAAGNVIYFQWNDDYWLPSFQFVRPGMSVRPGLTRVLRELSPVLDAWDLARWFVHPSPWLGGELPVSLITTQGSQVEQAAHADRLAIETSAMAHPDWGDRQALSPAR